jgi:hypothetical protein
MKTNKLTRWHQWLFLTVAFVVAIISVGCSSNGISSGGNTNPLGAYQSTNTGGTSSSGGVIDGGVTNPGAITSPIVTVPDNGGSVNGHDNAPLLDNYHPGWQQSSCLSCHYETSKNPDHNYTDDTSCYLCHGTNGLPGFGDTIPPIISKVSVTAQETSVKIQWNTDEDCVSRIVVKTTGGDRFEYPVSTVYQMSHNYTISGLQPSTTYYYEIICSDKSNNQTTTSSFGSLSFQTSAKTTITPGSNDGGTVDPGTVESFFSDVSFKSGGSFRIDVKFTVSEPARCAIYFVREETGNLAEDLSTYVVSTYDSALTGFSANTQYIAHIEAITDEGKEYKSKKYKVKTDKY